MHQVFAQLDLRLPGLEAVRQAVAAGAESQAEGLLLQYYRERTTFHGFMLGEGRSYASVAADMHQLPQVEQAHVLKVAAELARHEFLFQEPWDMERTQVPYRFDGEIDWELNPAHDPEWTFMLNRQNYLTVLAQAYMLTGDSRYTRLFEALVTDWINKNPVPKGHTQTSWRSLDSGIRLRNWVKALEILLHDESFDPGVFADMCASAAVHLEYLTRGWNLNRLQTNWVVIEANGAYIGGLFFHELTVVPQVEAQCLPYVAQAALTQETAEGMHWEQSNQYHNEVLLKLAEIELLAKRNDRTLPAAIPAVVRRMALAAARFRKPDGTQDNYGDSDREYLDDLLVLIEQITGQTLLDQHRVAVPNRLVLTHFGRVTPQPDPLVPLYAGSFAFTEAGIYLFKDPALQLHTRFKCGFLGHGHGHDDLLHVALFANGEDILIDSGRYSYEDARHHRLAFKSPRYHNTSMVDGIAINAHANCWDAKKVTHAVNAHASFHEALDFAEGGHLGYLDLPKPVYTNRKVLYVKPDLFVIVDEFIGSGEHQYQQFLHFKREQLSAGETANTLIYHDQAQRPYYVTTFDSNAEQHGAFTIASQDVSDDYNEKHPAPMATYTVSGQAPLSICTFITLGGVPITITPVAVQNESGVDRHSSNASAFKLGDDHYLVINHFEDADSRRGYLVDGHQVYGRVALVTPTGITRAY